MYCGQKVVIGSADEVWKKYPDMNPSSYEGMDGVIREVLKDGTAIVTVPEKVEMGKSSLTVVPLCQLIARE